MMTLHPTKDVMKSRKTHGSRGSRALFYTSAKRVYFVQKSFVVHSSACTFVSAA